MKIEGEGHLLRIYVGENDRWEKRPLYEAIVETARTHGLAGATVLRGIEGFGAHTRIHTTKVLRLSEDLPVVVEIVDTTERIEKILPVPVPWEAVIGGRSGRWLEKTSRLLARIWPSAFAFQFLVTCRPLPGVEQVLGARERLAPGGGDLD